MPEVSNPKIGHIFHAFKLTKSFLDVNPLIDIKEKKIF